jgi:hypothetical protein
LGIVTLISLVGKKSDDMDISVYVAAMCFIEAIDIYYDYKSHEAPEAKKPWWRFW